MESVFCKTNFSRSILFALMLMLAGWTLVLPSAAFAATEDVRSDGTAAVAEKPHGRGPAWPHENSNLPPDPAITYGRLENGFGYVLMPNRRPEKRVSLHLLIRAGSLHETEDQRGLAHFLEHMLFNGSTHFPPGELIQYFQRIGMRFGADANARTGFDKTVYDLILPSGDEQHLTDGLLVMRDYAMGALLLEKEVQRERGVILAEMRARDSADYRTFKAALKFELQGMRIPHRFPIGKTDVIRQADRKALKRFYDAWYRPDNAVLVMVGEFSVPSARQLIEDQFKDFVPRAKADAMPSIGSVQHKGLNSFFHHEPEAGGTTVSIEVLRNPEPVPDSLELQQRLLRETMADMIVQNRLDRRLKKPHTPFTSAAIGSGVYLKHIRYAEISADSSAEKWPQTLAALEQELRRALLHGFAASELQRVKQDLLSILDNSVKEMPTRDSTGLARNIIRHLSNNRVFQSPRQAQANLAPVIESVGVEEIHGVFKENWPHDHRLVLVTGSADPAKGAPNLPEKKIRDAYLASAATTVNPYPSAEKAVFPYLPAAEDTGSIVAREGIADLGIVSIRFGNGVRLNLKRTDYKTNQILANLVFGPGKSAEPAELPGISMLGASTVNESGFGAMDNEQLERALAGKNTSLDFHIGESHFNLFIESVPAEVELMFQLIRTQLVDPGFREDALALEKRRFRQKMKALSRSIDGMLDIEGNRFLAGEDSRFGIPTMQQVEKIRLDDIRSWIAPRLARAPLELSVAGDMDEKQVIELARRYLGTLHRRNQVPAVPRDDLPAIPKGIVKHIPVDTRIPKALVVAAWQTDDFWDIRQTRRLAVLADIFSERLRLRIREKLGASYSPFAFNRASRAYKGYGVLQAQVSVSPDQTDPVLAEVKAIAADLAENGVAVDELARTVDPILTSIRERRKTNGYWLHSVMSASSRHPQQFEWAGNFLEDYAAVTVAEVNRLAAVFLTEDRFAGLIIHPQTRP
jgi:zinc protease